MTKTETDKLKEKLREKPKEEFTPTDGVSIGYTPLNLACSGHPDWGFPLGCFILLVGDAGAGKTFIANTCFAEAAINPKFDKYDFIYDGPEYGALMDMKKFFGRAADRIKPPKKVDGEPVFSHTTEDLFYNLDDCLNRVPTIYVMDSFDSLDSEDDSERFYERKKWVQKGRKGQEPSGSYGTAKAKVMSNYLRQIPSKLQKTKSIFIGISQTRTNIGFGAMFSPKTRGGGLALTFYNTLELWLSIKEKLHKKERGHDVETGIRAKVKVKRNRITGRETEVLVPIYWGSGIDDVGGMIEWMIDWKYWKEQDGNITAKELNLSRPLEELISIIEADGLEPKLKSLVAEKWKEIEAAVAVKRKPKYI